MTVPSDWDFQSTAWSLYASDYVSPPSSLLFSTASSNYWRALYRGNTCIPEGRMIGYWKTPDVNTGRPGFCFHSQSPLGVTTPISEYRVDLHINGARWTKWYSGFPGVLIEFPYKWHPASGVWHWVRVTWWYQCTPQNVRKLAISFEYWNVDAWVSLGTVYDTSIIGNGTLVNRCGVCFSKESLQPATLCQQDDTQLWLPSV